MNEPLARAKNLRMHFESTGSLVYVPDKYAIYELNKTATRILQLCDGKNTVEQVAEILAREYACNKDEIIEDIKDAINNMKNKGIITKGNV